MLISHTMHTYMWYEHAQFAHMTYPGSHHIAHTNTWHAQTTQTHARHSAHAKTSPQVKTHNTNKDSLHYCIGQTHCTHNKTHDTHNTNMACSSAVNTSFIVPTMSTKGPNLFIHPDIHRSVFHLPSSYFSMTVSNIRD